MGIGIDIVKVDRISQVDQFADFILSPREKEIYLSKGNKKEFLAGRFAAKEAFLKANHKGIGDILLRNIEVLYGESGEPVIHYMDKIYKEVSISHEREYAVAVVNI